jgi:hypothetical protein
MTVMTGTLSDTTRETDSTGLARTQWTLGTSAGPQHATMHADGVTQSLMLTATATAAPAPHHRPHH